MPRDTKEALRRIEDALLELEEPEVEEETEEIEEAEEDTEEEDFFDLPDPEYIPPQRGISCLAAFALMLMGGILIMLMLFWLKIKGIIT